MLNPPVINPKAPSGGNAALAACHRFLAWLGRAGYESYDPYDIWGTRYGLWSRKVYYAKGKFGIPLVAPLVALDLIYPALRGLFVKKERFATADAQLLLGLLNLYQLSGGKQYLERAVALGEDIMDYSIPDYRGACWGYPFDWQNNQDAVWPRNTPYITCTPYCYEAYLGLLEASGDKKYLNLAAGIAEFVHGDLKDLPTGPESAAGSYSPFDKRQVVNASAYRAYVLADAGKRFGRKDYLETSRRNLNFVIDSQAEDGSWLYAMNEAKSYIDNFHTCFNLKNLFKIHRIEPDLGVENSIRRGFAYYRQHLIDAEGNPKPFAIKPRLQLAKLEIYDFAEGITLGTLIGSMIPEAGDLARRLADKLIQNYQLPDGHFVTRIFRGGFRHCFPFLRWPQAQLFYALTNLLKTQDSTNGTSS
ncbi:MAG: hypothetical protein WCP35_01205 [Verrucomicrobiota bacterium]